MRKHVYTSSMALSGLFIFAAGLLAVVGHLAGNPNLYHWGGEGDPGMALSTGICFVVLGINTFTGFIILGQIKNYDKDV